jgi:hypothetical protein
MSSQHSFIKHYRCCGVQITFYEQCGHTLTEYDHHSTCTHHSLIPENPTSQPQCEDLHRYIQIIDAKCTCSSPAPQIGKSHTTSSWFDQDQPILTEEEIFERGVYWLNELLLAREAEYQGTFVDWEESMRERRGVEEALKVPLLERTFGYDPVGLRGDFVTKVEGSGLPRAEKRCAMSQEMSSVDLRRLPCGCVLDLKRIQSRFAVSKCCPSCRAKFRLVKAPGREDSPQCEGRYPIWEDDDYSNFI